MRANDFTFDIMQEAIDFPNESVTNVSRYYISESTGTGYWNSSYKWLKQVRDIYNLATAQNNKNYQAIAMVMNAGCMRILPILLEMYLFLRLRNLLKESVSQNLINKKIFI
jgi:hypothetical protein